MRNLSELARDLAAAAVLLAFVAPVCAQTTTSPAPLKRTIDLSAGYTYLHANAPPGGCGCFSMNGGSASAAFGLTPSLSVAADLGVTHAGNILNSTETLTLATYLFGPRYTQRTHVGRVLPYGQVLLGGTHSASNFVFNSGGNGFSMLAGGGVDVPFKKHFAWRAVQMDYLLTRIPNGSSNSQNNFRVTTGLVYRFDRR
jgi:outer membrane immunogenic protein